MPTEFRSMKILQVKVRQIRDFPYYPIDVLSFYIRHFGIVLFKILIICDVMVAPLIEQAPPP